MLSDITAARDAALAEIDTASSLATVTELTTRLAGKKGQLAQLKTRLGSLDSIDEKKAAGQAINDAMTAVAAALEDRRAIVGSAALDERIAAERLDLTEFSGRPTRPRASRDPGLGAARGRRSSGSGSRSAEGPEVETDWHNFEALNMGDGHPARGEFDTLFVDHVRRAAAPAPRCCAPTPRRCRSARCSPRTADLHRRARAGVPPRHARRHAHAGVPPDRGSRRRP